MEVVEPLYLEYSSPQDHTDLRRLNLYREFVSARIQHNLRDHLFIVFCSRSVWPEISVPVHHIILSII